LKEKIFILILKKILRLQNLSKNFILNTFVLK